MKYWRGYLTAAILFACTWALREFARVHTVLVDMIYPYVTRMMQSFLAGWSSGVDFCLWQALILVLAAVAVASLVLLIIFKWNPVRWFGWVCAGVAAVMLLNTALYGLNEFSGSLSEDIYLDETDYTITELENAAVYYRDQANKLSEQVKRDSKGDVDFEAFEVLAKQAADGFDSLVYDYSLPVFAGPTDPVKKLGWAKHYTARGVTGVMVGLTGEAAVNPEVPAVMLPFAICREMAHRMSLLVERDASFGAYMACIANEDIQFRYSGALMAYRYCLVALEELDAVTGADAAKRVGEGATVDVRRDLLACNGFFGDTHQKDANTCDLLTSWHIQEVVLPTLVEEESLFDPLDKTQVDLRDHPYA